MQKSVASPIKIFLAFAAVYVIWGTTYFAVRVGIRTVPPFLLATIRYIIAGGVLLSVSAWKEGTIFNHNARRNFVLGIFMLTLGQAVLFWACKYIPTGLAAIFISTLPICYILIDRRNWRAYFTSRLTLVSIVLGLIGIVILFRDVTGLKSAYPGLLVFAASLVCIISCLFWAGASLYYKYHIASHKLFGDVGWQLAGGALSCIIVSAVSGELHGFHFNQVAMAAWGSVAYLAIAGSVIAFTAMYWLLTVKPATVVGTYAYVNPVIAVLLGYFLLKEQITALQIVGMAIILVAAYLANTVKFDHS